MIDYNEVLNNFKKYLDTLPNKNSDIMIKISHSYHVADIGAKLSKRLELNEEDSTLLKTMGLLHDIGRFIQYEKVKMYNDTKSKLDHASLGIDYLFKENHIKDFGIPSKYYDTIKIAIENHNKLNIDKKINGKERYFAKLLRDIDKIDILRQDATAIDYIKFDSHVSREVEKSFMSHELVNSKHVKNKSDSFVSQLAYIFDINFKESFELLNDTDNLELYLTSAPVDKYLEEEFNKYANVAREFLKERID